MTGQVSREHEFNVSSGDVWVFNCFSEKRMGSHQFGASYTTSGGDGQPQNAEGFFYLNLITDIANFDTAMYDDVEVA